MKIKNIAEFNKLDTSLDLPRISSEEITIIDVDDIWDGPLCGSCIWKDKGYYFSCFDQVAENGDDKWPRKFFLISLNEKQKEGSDEEVSIDQNQIVGWFDTEEINSQTTNFMRSYFKWKENK